MMPDLGRYATEVLSAYAVSVALLLVIALMSWRRWRRVREEMERIERRRDGPA